MNISYSMTKEFTSAQLEELFASVGWKSAAWPERLVKAMKGSQTVISAWDGVKLTGLLNVIDDGEMTAYVHYLLVNPDYQGNGIGTGLMNRFLEKYSDYLTLVLTAEHEGLIAYYEKLGFEVIRGGTPMVRMNRK